MKKCIVLLRIINYNGLTIACMLMDKTTLNYYPKSLNQTSTEMKKLLLLILFLTCLYFASSSSISIVPSNKGERLARLGDSKDGKGCAICVFALTLVEKEIKKGAGDISKILAGICKYIPNQTLEHVCETLVTEFGQRFIEFLLKKEEPDWICSKLKICKTCHIHHDSKKYYSLPREERRILGMDNEDQNEVQQKARIFAAILSAQLLQGNFSSSYPNIPPKVDLDKDHFSGIHFCHRGADWRGKDCNDLSSKIYPGVVEDSTSFTDGNCNGVYGKKIGADKSYESLYCQSYEHDRQLVFFGDSATAGFSIPVEWVSLQNLTNILPAIVDELDWPMKAWTSGYDDSINGQSFYMLFRQHNRCAHRQFQSLGTNGAKMEDLVGQIQQTHLSQNDKPVFAFVAYIGNDICRKTLQEMTTPENYRKQLLDGLALLDSKVAPNSKVVLLGIADGEIMWDHMHNLTHPFGVTYEQFYSFLECTDNNPCNTWLTEDVESRKAATARAKELSSILEEVSQNQKFKNIELAYLDFSILLEEAFVQLEKKGIAVNQLIDAVDGFHPSIQYGHRILSPIIYAHIMENHPDFLGPENPNNQQIQDQFGDQGGH